MVYREEGESLFSTMMTTTGPRGHHLLAAVGLSAFTLITFRKFRSGLGMLRPGISVHARHHTNGPKGKQGHRDEEWQIQPSVIDKLRESISVGGPDRSPDLYGYG